MPALVSCLPTLFHHATAELQVTVRQGLELVAYFLVPALQERDWSPPTFGELWNQSLTRAMETNSNFTSFMLQNFDTDGDGHIGRLELLNVKDILPLHLFQGTPPQHWFAWLQRSWPMLDWKLGVFLWRTCSGLIIVFGVGSILPGRLHGYSGRMLRFPILGIVYFMISVELVVYTLIRLFIRTLEAFFSLSKHRALRNSMANSKSYAEWYAYASKLDKSQGRDIWRETDEDDTSYQYNWPLIRELMDDMKQARDREDPIMALAVLQQCTRKNVGGVMSEDLFSYTYTGEPKLIVSEFIDEVVVTLRWITQLAKTVGGTRNKIKMRAFEENLRRKVTAEKSKIAGSVMAAFPLESRGVGQNRNVNPSSLSLDREQAKAFLKRARAAYGRTALCLSGGSMMGNYHFGHIKALMEMDALPQILSGTSAGSAIAAFLCTRNDEEVDRDLKPEMLYDKLQCFTRTWPERIKSFIQTGAMFDVDDWIDRIKWFTCGDMTFEEAYLKTGRVICITLSATTKKAPPVLVNHITAPNVTIASAIIASAAVPGFIHPVRLQVKDENGCIRSQKDQTWWDGSIEQDIPTAGLAEMFNCHFFIAAQCNPHIVPLFYSSKGDVGRPSRWSSGMREDSWRGGFLLSALEMYLKSDMRAKFKFLLDVDAAKGFHASLFTQSTYSGSTTIVPQVALIDYFKLFSNQTLKDLERYFQGGTVAAFQHIAMIKLHYRIANALTDCLAELEDSDRGGGSPRRRSVSNSRDSSGPDDEFEIGFDGISDVPHSTTSSSLRPGQLPH